MLLCIYMHRECGSKCRVDAIVRLPCSKACTTNAITIAITTTLQKLSPTSIALSSSYRKPAAMQKQYQDHTKTRPRPDQDQTKAMRATATAVVATTAETAASTHFNNNHNTDNKNVAWCARCG